MYGKPLLQVGSNLFELIEFTIQSSGNHLAASGQGAKAPAVFGVNVAKVREVIRLPNIVPCLSSSPEVLGVFNLRGLPIPAIHLAKALGLHDEPVTPTSQVIVTEFQRRVAGFIVSGARRIRRVSWDKVLPPSSDAFNSITGMMLVENSEFIFILDFERILLGIEGHPDAHLVHSGYGSHDSGHVQSSMGGFNPHGSGLPSDFGMMQGQNFGSTQTKRPSVMVIDDSATARRAVCEMLRNFDTDIIEFTNGEAAWKALTQQDETGLDRMPDVIICDVEMPRLDGYSFVMRVRNTPLLAGLNIILHSSLTGDVNKERAKAAGANAYVSKFNKKEIMDAVMKSLPGGGMRAAS